MTLTLIPEKNDLDDCHLTACGDHFRSALSVSNTEKIQAKESSLPPTLQWYCIIMPCVARYAPLPVHNGLTIQANFPWAGLL